MWCGCIVRCVKIAFDFKNTVEVVLTGSAVLRIGKRHALMLCVQNYWCDFVSYLIFCCCGRNIRSERWNSATKCIICGILWVTTGSVLQMSVTASSFFFLLMKCQWCVKVSLCKSCCHRISEHLRRPRVEKILLESQKQSHNCKTKFVI